MSHMKSATSSRIFTFLAALMLVFSVFGPVKGLSASTAFSPVAAYAADGDDGGGRTVNDLFGQVSIDNIGGGFESEEVNLEDTVGKAQEIAQWITAICTIISIVVLIVCITKLSTSAGNPQKRQLAMAGLGVSILGIVLLGGSFMIVTFAWNLLAGM